MDAISIDFSNTVNTVSIVYLQFSKGDTDYMWTTWWVKPGLTAALKGL